MRMNTINQVTPCRPTYPLRFALIGTAALVAALSSTATADLIVDNPDGYAVRSQGSVSAGARVLIEGSLGAAGNASLGANSVVTGELSTGTPYAWFTPSVGSLPSWGTKDIAVGKNKSLSLDAGVYDKFTSSQGASLVLDAGEYVFSTFDLAKAGRVLADTSAGDVYLYIGKQMSASSDTVFETTGGGNLFIVTGGAASFGSGANIQASLYSLGSQSFGSSTQFLGTTWSGGAVSIGADSVFMYSSVPSPAAVALLAIAGLVGRRRRR